MEVKRWWLLGVVMGLAAQCLLLPPVSAWEANGTVGGWIAKKSEQKAKKLAKLVSRVENEEKGHVKSLTESRFGWSSPHHKNMRFVIFAISLKDSLGMKNAEGFVGTARKTGFDGDIVLAIHPEVHHSIQKYLSSKHATVYGLDVKCSGENPTEVCTLPHEFDTAMVPIAMLRFYIYQWWALQYGSNTVIMLSDFRDVFFQKNPFSYKFPEWRPPEHQLTVFQEFFPNKVISRCGHNRRWIRLCYGNKGLSLIETNTVLCSGVTMGSRDAIIGYSALMVRQLNAKVRFKDADVLDEEVANKKCFYMGMDQGVHNWLVYTGLLDMYMNVKIYQQGEGPVNTVGAFTGGKALIRKTLREWGVLDGEAPNAVVYNWNKEASPVVHQLDRFLNSEDIKGGYRGDLKAFQDL